jgi:hypothetical protein
MCCPDSSSRGLRRAWRPLAGVSTIDSGVAATQTRPAQGTEAVPVARNEINGDTGWRTLGAVGAGAARDTSRRSGTRGDSELPGTAGGGRDVVERSRAWMMHARCHARDYERLVQQHSETLITWAATTLMSRRLPRKGATSSWPRKPTPTSWA